MSTRPFPSFYEPARVGTLYVPRAAEVMAAGRADFVEPASDDQLRVILLLVDTQVDFVHTDGALSVPGAVNDTRRTIDFILTNTLNQRLTAIAASLDTHIPIQIFSPSWWEDFKGNEPPPFTAITAADVDSRTWRPRFERKWSHEYVHKLETQARKPLMIWPYHTLEGTVGRSLTPALYEAIAYHTIARLSQPTFLVKGTIAKTEHYSILEPEIKVPDHPLGGLNTAFLDMLATYHLIYIAGQAKSHCVLETAESVMRYFASQPEVIARIRFMMDCMSSVSHPDIDFEAIAAARFAEFARQGASLVRSTDPVG